MFDFELEPDLVNLIKRARAELNLVGFFSSWLVWISHELEPSLSMVLKDRAELELESSFKSSARVHL